MKTPTTPTAGVLDGTLAAAVMRANGRVTTGAVRMVAVCAEAGQHPGPIAVQHAGQHAGPIVVLHAGQHAGPIAVPHVGQHAGPIAALHAGPLGALQAAVVTSMMVSVKDVVRQIESGVILETPVHVHGEASKTLFDAEFALMDGITAMIGVPEPSTRVPRKV